MAEIGKGPIRVLANFSEEQTRNVTEAALEYYAKASMIATDHLNPCNPIRLGLALNFSVLYGDLLKNEVKAEALVQSVLLEALPIIEQVEDDEMYKDANDVIQILKDNLGHWQSKNKDLTALC
jgi:14-3-3 protein epsilon